MLGQRPARPPCNLEISGTYSRPPVSRSISGWIIVASATCRRRPMAARCSVVFNLYRLARRTFYFIKFSTACLEFRLHAGGMGRHAVACEHRLKAELQTLLSGGLMRYLGCIVLLLIGVAIVPAQDTRGGISGTVTDTRGAVISGATVVVSNTGAGTSARLTTNSSGY